MSKSTAVLLVNLGSARLTENSDVRRYLREFLMDARVLDAPYPVRFGAVHGWHFCRSDPSNRRRPTEGVVARGSPLIVTSKRVRRQLQARVAVPVELAMRYQNPSIETHYKVCWTGSEETAVDFPVSALRHVQSRNGGGAREAIVASMARIFP